MRQLTGNYTVDDKVLIAWAKGVLERVLRRELKKDSQSEEDVIITAQDILFKCQYIPSYLVNEPIFPGIRTINTDIITIIPGIKKKIMVLKKGNYTANRREFVVWANPVMVKLVESKIQEDLIKGSEYVLTANDLLEACEAIPYYLINEPLPPGTVQVHHSIVKLIYKQDEDEILPTITPEQ